RNAERDQSFGITSLVRLRIGTVAVLETRLFMLRQAIGRIAPERILPSDVEPVAACAIGLTQRGATCQCEPERQGGHDVAHAGLFHAEFHDRLSSLRRSDVAFMKRKWNKTEDNRR